MVDLCSLGRFGGILITFLAHYKKVFKSGWVVVTWSGVAW